MNWLILEFDLPEGYSDLRRFDEALMALIPEAEQPQAQQRKYVFVAGGRHIRMAAPDTPALEEGLQALHCSPTVREVVRLR